MSGELSFFELGVADGDRAREFYGALFGWEFEPGPSGGGYAITTPSIPGGIHGGDEGASPYVFFAVDDMDVAIAKVRELGGEAKPLGEHEESEQEFGRFVLCQDDQGSSFGLHQAPSGG
jgi:uncharacterized protein